MARAPTTPGIQAGLPSGDHFLLQRARENVLIDHSEEIH
jgi:hypothetical protein